MPYIIQKNDKDEYCVYKKDEEGNPTGDSFGCHPTEEKAQAQIEAMYANETKSEIRLGFYQSSIKAIEDSEDWKLEVLGAPYGWDRDNEQFTEKTDFMLNVGDTRPAIYFHGLEQTGNDWAEKPELIGKATVTRRDDKGLWFEVILDKANKFAKRIWEAAKQGIARASSGAINHLVRYEADEKTISVWPIGELSLIDESLFRHPANPRAVAMPVKAMFESANIELPEAFIEGEKPGMDAVKEIEAAIIPQETKEMEDTEKQELTAEVSKAVLDALKAKEDAEKAEKEKLDAIKAEARKEAEEEIKAKIEPALKGGFSVKKLTELGFKNDDKNTFKHWLKTGDEVAAKAALQEGTTTEGGYAVPNDFYDQFVAKRAVVSGVRRAGVRVIQTTRDYVDIATEDTATTTFVRTAEEGAYDENEPTVGQVQITIHKWTKLTKISEELVADDGCNLVDFLMNDYAIKAAQTEDRYVINGSGTNQHKGVLALTSLEANWLDFDSTGNITADEIPELLYKLNSAYRANASWFMHNTVEGYLRKIASSSVFSFQPYMNTAEGMSQWSTLFGRPIYNEANMTSTLATGNQVIMVGDMSYYALAERASLVVSRNPYLYQGNGQIGFFAHFRQGGAPLQYEAFAIGEMA